MRIITLIAILLIFAFAPHAVAFDDFDAADYGLLTASTLMITADWMQTREIAKNPQTWHEHNPILGEHPSVQAVDLYCVVAILGNIAVAYILPDEWRKAWLVAWIGIEAGYVQNNYRIGVRF